MERRAEKQSHKPLPEPDLSQYTVVVEEHGRVPVSELFQGVYLRRTIVILSVWVLGYLGLDYGMSSQQGVYLIAYYSASNLFLITFLGGLAGSLVMTVLGSILNERVERRTWIFVAGSDELCRRHLVLRVAERAVGRGDRHRAGHRRRPDLGVQRVHDDPGGLPDPAAGDGLRLHRRPGARRRGVRPDFRGWLFTETASTRHIGWFLEFAVLGGLVPGFISLIWGMRQREAILEVVSR